jgi:Tfp pilus assembly ATPase PilU
MLSKLVDMQDPKLYYHLNLAMKGVVGQLDKAALQKIKKVLSAEHQKNLKFIDDLIKKGEVQQSDLKKAS